MKNSKNFAYKRERHFIQRLKFEGPGLFFDVFRFRSSTFVIEIYAVCTRLLSSGDTMKIKLMNRLFRSRSIWHDGTRLRLRLVESIWKSLSMESAISFSCVLNFESINAQVTHLEKGALGTSDDCLRVVRDYSIASVVTDLLWQLLLLASWFNWFYCNRLGRSDRSIHAHDFDSDDHEWTHQRILSVLRFICTWISCFYLNVWSFLM